ncbi:MAG: response regulator transcription factor [Chloroflexi bacterium]|nr:response regulator transcription factor [Chloroflexota bacterium]
MSGLPDATPPRIIRVAIVDDHPALREGTASLLSREPDIEVIGTVGSLAEIRALIDGPGSPDVVVQDIRLGEESGLQMLGGGRPEGSDRAAGAERPASVPGPAIILWTAYDYPQYAAFAYRAGAAGFVVKTAPTAELIAAIRRVADGGVYFSSRPDLGARALSGRERDVLSGVVDGRGNDEIGRHLGVTTRTVESHLTRLYERFEVHSRTELATRAVREGWLDVPAEG